MDENIKGRAAAAPVEEPQGRDIPNDYLQYVAAHRAQPHPLQRKVDDLLKRGIIFSIFWLMGIGSLIAVVNAFRARRMIKQSNGEIRGMDKVWWCLIIGGAGLLLWGYVVIMVIINKATT